MFLSGKRHVHLLIIGALLLDSAFSCMRDAHVWLTISAAVNHKAWKPSKFSERFIQLNWLKVPSSKDSWIGLFDRDLPATVSKQDAVIWLDSVEKSEGSFRTNVSFPVEKFDESSLEVSRCIKYYIAYVDNGQVKAKNCIRTRAKWMEDKFGLLINKSLSELLIPGTHNSGAYTEGFRWKGWTQWVEDQFSLCQDESIFNQLVYGIRFLDLRVMWAPKDGEDFWIAHDVFRMDHPLKLILQQIKRFMDNTKKEVIIVDFHRFPKGFKENAIEKHAKLLLMIEEYLGEYLVPYDNQARFSIKVGELVDKGKRLIIGYAAKGLVDREFLYPAASHIWGNTDKVEELKKIFDQRLPGQSYYTLRAAMAELTPQIGKRSSLAHLRQNQSFLLKGLRKLAEDVNQFVTKWFRDFYWKYGSVVSTDFFLGNNIVEVSIENLERENVCQS